MGQLQDGQRPVAATLLRRRARLLDQGSEHVEVAFMDGHLQLVGPALGRDRAGFEPEKPGPARGEAPVSAHHQVAGRAIQRAVAALHRQNGDGIGGDPVPHAHALRQRGKVFRQGELQAQGGDLRLELF